MSEKDGQLLITYREQEGEVDRRRLAGMLGAATTVMLLFVIVAFSLGMVGAALGVGLGGFVANFDQVQTNNTASIYPVLGEQAACETAPQLQAALNDDVEIIGTDGTTPAVEFFKDLPLPDSFNNGDEFARITITGNGSLDNPIQASNLDLRLTALEANELALGDKAGDAANTSGTNFDFTGVENASIAEMNVDGASNPEDVYAENESTDSENDPVPIGPTTTLDNFEDQTEFGISGEGFVIDQGTAAAHQVTFDGINLQGVNLAVQILNGSTGSGEVTNAVLDPTTPSSTDCEALSDHAELDDQPYMGNDTDVTSADAAGIQLDEDTEVTADEGQSPRSDDTTAGDVGGQ